MYELINGTPMPIREYNGQRVVTFKDIDSVHQRPEGTAGRNFRTNRKHFIEGVDFFKITPDEFRRAIGEMDSRQQNDIILVTLNGYLMISKSFTDDLSWDVQRMLVTYFTAREQVQTVMNTSLQEDKLLLFHQRQTELESSLNQLESNVESRMEQLERKMDGEELTARDIATFNSLLKMFVSPTCKLTIGVEPKQQQEKD